MPSCLLGFQSGGLNILSGVAQNLWSGTGPIHPVGEVRLYTAITNSGNVYVALSGGMTINSGGWFLSGNMGSGYLDGIPMPANTNYNIPKLAFYYSGQPQIYVNPDANCSGQARLYWEIY